MPSLRQIEKSIPLCDRCSELREYCTEIGHTRKRAFSDWKYWAKPVPGFGDPSATVLIVGLAPGAHGANRTGRMFTGDRSGDFLYASLHRAGLANQASSTHRDDGLLLRGVYITAALRCAPPGNKPTNEQLKNCRGWMIDDFCALRPRVLLCLGTIAWRSSLELMVAVGETLPSPRPKFGHGAETKIGSVFLIGSYHVSQQNTFTGRLTTEMFDAVLARAQEIAA